jgi:hypothetical protein
VCDTSTNKCVQCLTALNCSGTSPICTATSTCAACSTAAQCKAADTSHPACSTTGACVQCTDNSTCSGTTPVCDTSTNKCVQCLSQRELLGDDAHLQHFRRNLRRLQHGRPMQGCRRHAPGVCCNRRLRAVHGQLDLLGQPPRFATRPRTSACSASAARTAQAPRRSAVPPRPALGAHRLLNARLWTSRTPRAPARALACNVPTTAPAQGPHPSATPRRTPATLARQTASARLSVPACA